jgi:hypothetical protein
MHIVTDDNKLAIARFLSMKILPGNRKLFSPIHAMLRDFTRFFIDDSSLKQG